ncbi:CRISPR-associated helicase Cas3' [Natranaerofaba carboxydovora]|uniref:CRISPR-associated helicase Cas3' n=1 Tax=Natranaerofaba carboxydovora TaxID=2742683 RepID=UPI001F1296E5|nr:CRISPR-associated helicase Cas3' [Natranaerofaba carboxydovora]
MEEEIIYSHYDEKKNIKKELKEHLNDVAGAAENSVPTTIQFDDILNSTDIRKLVKETCLFHDFGKFTDFFQTYLVNNKKHKLKRHSHISAIFLFNRLKLSSVLSHLKETEANKIAFLSYLAVRLHHMDLSVKDLFSYSHLPSQLNELKAQTDNILKRINKITQDIDLSEKEVKTYLENNPLDLNAKEHLKKYYMSLINFPHERWFFLLIYLYSQLIDKDKLDAGLIKTKEINLAPVEKVTDYISKKRRVTEQQIVNDDREVARKTIINNLQGLSDDEIKEHRIFTLTAPTGLGKTLSSLQAGLYLCERLSNIYDYTPKIITAIPFINIIEQTKKDYIEVFEAYGRVNVHHRLADLKITAYQNNDDKNRDYEKSLDQSLLEVEAWEGDVIMTTFVQLFQSIFSNSNSSLKKINKLAGNVVILDEIQSIPEKYMPVVGAMIIKLSEYFGSRFILMTATQPYIIELGKQLIEEESKTKTNTNSMSSLELLSDNQKYFEKLDRTKLIPTLQQPFDTNGFLEFFENTWNYKSSLIVVNTIKRCIEIFDALKNILSDEKKVKVLHLSTNLTPLDRKKIINEAENRLKEKNITVMVSTQTIEAGVDLDFDIGYRDLAPLDAIIQTAGRINRSGLNKENNLYISSPIYVFQLEKDHKYIYPFHQIEDTKKKLSSYEVIPEESYQQLIDGYFREYACEISDESREIWRAIKKLDFDVINKFKLIEDDVSVIDVFIELDENASQLADAYEMVKDYKMETDKEFISNVLDKKIVSINEFERKVIIKLLLVKLSEYMVPVRATRLAKNKAFDFSDRNGVKASFMWVPRNQIEEYYSKEKGYIELEDARMW